MDWAREIAEQFYRGNKAELEHLDEMLALKVAAELVDQYGVYRNH